jgi:adenylate cyclase
MAEKDFKRKLTAILSADAVGYSRLMAEDEADTVKTLATYRDVISSLINQHRGRVVDSPGDNILAEFSSVVDAVQCAVAMQNEIQTRNAELPDNRRMQFRIGINLGDVIDEEGRIYGDGVNISARLEALADPGGICVSKTAFDQIETKLPLGYEYLGEQSVKNIPKPVGAYRVLMKPDAAGKVIGEKRFIGRISRKTAMSVIVILIMIAGGLVGWNIYLQQSKKIQPASVEKMAFPLPEKPSIAVLPFANIGGDPEQEYFSDGLTEEIITALSKVPKLFVVARNSVFSYKGKSVKIHQVAEELGVKYVLEGSVRKAEEKIRITAQLIDALGGNHLWAERYEKDLKDIFVIQDEITLNILSALQLKLTEGEHARLLAKGTENLQAYLKYLQAAEKFHTVTKEGNSSARRLLNEAINLDPKFPAAYNLLGWTHNMDVMYGTSKSPKKSFAKAMELIKQTIALDDSYPGAYQQLGWIFIMTRKHEKAIIECERAVALEPNSADSIVWMSLALRYAGKHQEAVGFAEQAIRLNPMPTGFYFRNLGITYMFTGRYEEAIANFKKAIKIAPNDRLTHINMAVAYIEAGMEDEARAAVAEVLRINPKYSLTGVTKRLSYKDKADRDMFINALRKAGVPERPPSQ